MPDLADIKTITQQIVQGATGESDASSAGSCSCHPNLTSDLLAIQMDCQFGNASNLQVSGEDLADDLGFFGTWNQLSSFQIVTERHPSSHPHPFLLRGGDFVSNPLSRNLSFELRE